MLAGNTGKNGEGGMSTVEMDKQFRHMQAINHSNYLHLKSCLREAASRFADIADSLEKDRSYDPVSFMRASAKRYREEVETL